MVGDVVGLEEGFVFWKVTIPYSSGEDDPFGHNKFSKQAFGWIYSTVDDKTVYIKWLSIILAITKYIVTKDEIRLVIECKCVSDKGCISNDGWFRTRIFKPSVLKTFGGKVRMICKQDILIMIKYIHYQSIGFGNNKALFLRIIQIIYKHY